VTSKQVLKKTNLSGIRKESLLKGQEREMVQSLLTWIERIEKLFEFGLLLDKLGRKLAFIYFQSKQDEIE
jgi:hypothetical protein